MQMKSIIFMNSLLTNLISPKIQSCPKFLALKLCSKNHISLNTSCIPATEDSKFKSDCIESKNSYILLINVTNFKLRLVNFVYIFETPGIACCLGNLIIIATINMYGHGCHAIVIATGLLQQKDESLIILFKTDTHK